jgi:hypothetical protein
MTEAFHSMWAANLFIELPGQDTSLGLRLLKNSVCRLLKRTQSAH